MRMVVTLSMVFSPLSVARNRRSVYSEKSLGGTANWTFLVLGMSNGQRKRILSGVQPSGKLHLGNYFGAVRQHIALQDEAECFYFIADYHALTTIQDPKVLNKRTRDAAIAYWDLRHS